MGDGFRRTGKEKKAYDSAEPRHEKPPVCYARAADLEAEVGVPASGDSFFGIVLAVIGKERACDRFTPWHRGHSPEQHKAMIDARETRLAHEAQLEKERAFQKEMRERDQAFQREMKGQERRWQEEREERNRQWRAEQREKEEKRQEAKELADREWEERQKLKDRFT